MKILIPMAGEGQRFKEKGYRTSKPAIDTYNLSSGTLCPMVVCATDHLPGVLDGGGNLVYIERDYHRIDGTEDKIRKYFPNAEFVIAHQLTEGQACTCLLAEAVIDAGDELLIAGCDNGMVFDEKTFENLKSEADVIVFTYTNNPCVLKKPDAYGWMIPNGKSEIVDISIKKAVSNTPMNDHAVVATFWFKHGSIFLEAAKKMIKENDRINGEFYVDQTIRHVLQLGYSAKIFDVDRYIGWGTPEDYEIYQKTFEYWSDFYKKEIGRG